MLLNSALDTFQNGKFMGFMYVKKKAGPFFTKNVADSISHGARWNFVQLSRFHNDLFE